MFVAYLLVYYLQNNTECSKFVFIVSSGGPGQSSAKSSDKAFEDWLSDDVNSYQR